AEPEIAFLTQKATDHAALVVMVYAKPGECSAFISTDGALAALLIEKVLVVLRAYAIHAHLPCNLQSLSCIRIFFPPPLGVRPLLFEKFRIFGAPTSSIAAPA